MQSLLMATNRFGALVRERRERARLTQKELGEAVGLSGEGIKQIEAGRTKRAAPDVVNRMAQLLPVTVWELMVAMGYAIEEDAALHDILDERDNLIALVDQLRARLTRPPRGGQQPNER
jgi:transcriptional regulator with XRE-family HTH domain